MQKLVLVLLVSMLSFSPLRAQAKKKDFVGHWTSDGTTTECKIWIDKNRKFQCVEWDTDGGQVLEILSIEYRKKTLIVKTRYVENNWVVTTELTLIDKNYMKGEIVGDATATIIYRKLK